MLIQQNIVTWLDTYNIITTSPSFPDQFRIVHNSMYEFANTCVALKEFCFIDNLLALHLYRAT